MPMDTLKFPKPVILIVDDDQFMRDSFREALQGENFTVVEAAGGVQALDLFREFSPDLVLLDLIMPGMDGFTACQELRALPGGLYTPVLMVTGLDDMASINHAFEAGATDFISKPVNPGLLLFRIRYMLRASRSIKSLAESEARLATAQRVAQLGNWEWEPGSGIFQGSEETFRILGIRNRTEILPFTGFLIAIHPPDRVATEARLREVSTSGTPTAFECRISRGEGQTRLARIQAWRETEGGGGKQRICGTIHDISELKQTEDRLLLLKQAIDSLPIGITISNDEGKIAYINHTEARNHGYSVDELVGKEACKLAPAHLRSPFPAESISTGKIWQRESTNVRRDGSDFPVQLSSIAVRSSNGTFLGVVTACEDISTRKETEKRIHHLAYFDALTGLPNRGAFLDRLNQAISFARRQSHIVGLVFLDLDDFKDINDSLGHDFGDKLLRQVANRLATVMRESDTLARLGGDEFVVVLSSVNNQDSTAFAAQRILATFREPFDIDGIKVNTGASIGIAIYPDNGEDAETLYKCADTAMYHAKDDDRGHYRFFSDEMNRQVMHRIAVEKGLRHAVENGELVIHYQPQWDLRTCTLTGVEALIRWNSPDFGLMKPTDFIPVAERSGQIIGLGEWVIRTSFNQALTWQTQGHRDIKMAVNISGRQLRQPDFLDLVTRLIGETGIDPALIEFEFTESVIMEKADVTISILKKLKKMGITLSVDDFGTGYSSLSYLKHFPIDRIKIDQSFIAELGGNKDDAAIVEAVISLGHILNLKVMAEGVENIDQMQFLIDQGCDEVQGFHFARPMSPGDVTALLETLKLKNIKEIHADTFIKGLVPV
jgi:diguanylate cyclase (GGDEF)-like protein/PAS domain S-box-containing protein